VNIEKLISLKENFTGQRFQWIKPVDPQLLGKVVKCRDILDSPDGQFYAIFDDGSRINTNLLNSHMMMIHGDSEPLSRVEVESIYGSVLNTKRINTTASPETAQPTQSSKPEERRISKQTADSTNMFKMFNSEETEISIKIKVKLPDKKLLKMMYTQAEDSDKFLSELSEYLLTVINKQVVADSMQSQLDPTAIKKPGSTAGNITIREVNES
jgi:hypothetical protein